MSGEPPSAKPWIPARLTLPALTKAAKGCEGCELYARATQTVFGEGSAAARVMLVGEQPGDKEDLDGHPFVGPAGRVLFQALEDAGVDRQSVYVTNAVKHFRFEERGKRRIHKKPAAVHITACLPWLEAEIQVLRPDFVVCLGATAAQSLAGSTVRVLRDRGKLLPNPWATALIVTVHPSSLLRMPDRSQYQEQYDLFVRDLKLINQRAA
ncbi:MAG: UdgX family uracil-DNA binding protein [Acidobacteriia bacterium]|nr:UdgX family uracil-DNA binding protein [Terriglobia bacterium]